MKSLQTLINAATLKGYLKAMGADADITGVAQAIIDAEIACACERIEPVITGDRKAVVDVSNLSGMIRKLPAEALSHDESRFAGPEMAQAEENGTPAGEEDPSGKNDSVRTGGGRAEGKARIQKGVLDA